MGISRSWPIPVIQDLRNWTSLNGAAGFLGTGLRPMGNVWYVNSSSPNALDSGGNPLSPGPRNQGTDPSTPFATLAYAIGGAVTSSQTPSGVRSNNGDIVIVGVGHVETIAATPITMALGGVTVVFQGNGFADRAQIQLTNTASQLLITGAGNHFVCPMFVTGVDAVVAGIQVQAADTVFEDVEYYDQPAKASLIQLLTTAAANRLRINGYRYYASTTGTQKTEAIRIVGGSGAELQNIQIRGDFGTAPFNNITTAFSDMRISNMQLENTHAGATLGMAILITSTGSSRGGIEIATTSGTPWVTTNNIFCFQLGDTGTKPTAATAGTALV